MQININICFQILPMNNSKNLSRGLNLIASFLDLKINFFLCRGQCLVHFFSLGATPHLPAWNQSVYFLVVLTIKKKIIDLMVIISLELTRVNPDRNIFSINVELTCIFLLYRGLVNHRILNLYLMLATNDNILKKIWIFFFFKKLILIFSAAARAFGNTTSTSSSFVGGGSWWTHLFSVSWASSARRTRGWSPCRSYCRFS